MAEGRQNSFGVRRLVAAVVQKRRQPELQIRSIASTPRASREPPELGRLDQKQLSRRLLFPLPLPPPSECFRGQCRRRFQFEPAAPAGRSFSAAGELCPMQYE